MSCILSDEFKRDMKVFKKYICECRCLYDMFGFTKQDTTYIHFPIDIENPHIYHPTAFGTCYNTASVPEVIHHQPTPVQIPEIIIEEEYVSSDENDDENDDDDGEKIPKLPPHPPSLSTICVSSSSDSLSDILSPQSNESLDIVEAEHDLQVSTESSHTERDSWHIL